MANSKLKLAIQALITEIIDTASGDTPVSQIVADVQNTRRVKDYLEATGLCALAKTRRKRFVTNCIIKAIGKRQARAMFREE